MNLIIITDLMKQRFNKGVNPNIYFWRDQSDYEVDCIIEEHNRLIPAEIKSTQTFNPHFFEYLTKWNDLLRLILRIILLSMAVL